KIVIDLEDEVVSLLEKEKANLKTIESLKSKVFESSENEIFDLENQSENDCHVVEKECDKVENSKVIAPGLFKLNLDTFSSVRRPKHSDVIWKKKGSSITSNVNLSLVSLSKLNKNVKRYSRKDLLSCNNSHLGETSSAYVCNDAMNVSCNSRMCDLFNENNLFIFDDESVRISSISKMPFRKKPRDSMNAEAITTACFTQNRSIIHKRFDKTPYDLMNKKKPNINFFRVFGCRGYLLNDYEDVGKLKAKGDIRVFVGYSKESFSFNSEDVGKLKAKGDIGVFVGYSKESSAFRIYNKRTRKIHESVNVNFDEISEMASKQFTLEPGESSSSSLNDDVQQSSKEVILPQTNTQSISNNMNPNVDEASTSHNVFNERLEDAYFDASTSFHDLSNVHTFYQPYLHEKK
nr:hypothetical protein [Tanacetum cinerariifolium]